MFRGAGAAEIIRSHQKDDTYLAYLRSSLSDISQCLLGPRTWLHWRKEVDLLANFGYFFLTTLGDFQTLGEEYVNIVQVNRTRKNIPSKWRRLVMVLLHVCAPYCINKSLEWLEKYLKTPQSQDIPEETRTFLLKCIPVARHVFTFIQRSHLAFFYLNAVYYHLAKRMTGVQYLKYSTGMSSGSSALDKSFHILGYLSLAQLVVSLIIQIYQACAVKKQDFVFKQDDTTENERLDYVDPSRKCSLCLEERKSSTATPCGHLFCWTCIHEWCQTKAQCPLCREKLLPQSLVFLQNYDPQTSPTTGKRERERERK